MVVKIGNQNFEKEVAEARLPVFIDFYADWCGPCQMAGPVIDELAEEYKGKVKVGKVDVDKDQALAQKYGVMSIPAVLIFKDGKEVKRAVGFPGKAGYEALIKEALK